jgi:heme-degrading monooxygenase HmoA
MMPFVSITRLRVRSLLYLPAFIFTALRIGGQARNAPGNLAASVFRDRRNTFWTSTCWESEASMKAFMLAAPHGPAMRKLLEWCDEAALVHWTQESAELPSWPEAHRRMESEGRPSKVNHPSAAQMAYSIPPPIANPRRESRLK